MAMPPGLRQPRTPPRPTRPAAAQTIARSTSAWTWIGRPCFPTIEAAVESGKAAWFWQTRAWSDGKLHDRAHIFQFEVDTKKHPVRRFGASVDFDRSLKADYGQWKIGQEIEEDFDMATGDEILAALKTLRHDLTVFGTHGLHETIEDFAKNQRTTRSQLTDLEKTVANLAAKVQALSQVPHA